METNGDFFPCLLFRPLNGRFFPVGWLWSSDGEESKGQNFAPPWRPWHPASIHTTPGSPTSASCSAPGPHMWASLRLLASALPHHGLGLPPQQPRDTIPASGGTEDMDSLWTDGSMGKTCHRRRATHITQREALEL